MTYESEFDAFFPAYVTAALWSSCDDSGEPLDAGRDVSDIAPETLETMRADCAAFYKATRDSIQCDGAPLGEHWDGATEPERRASMAGHDFWLNRCGHGAGFWDGDWPEPQATTLDKAATACGNVDLYIGDDSQVYA
tara:strand:+ start:2422 stop:2832 length:411 start_codon:yes stop_codon:yes gene_type:complete